MYVLFLVKYAYLPNKVVKKTTRLHCDLNAKIERYFYSLWWKENRRWKLLLGWVLSFCPCKYEHTQYVFHKKTKFTTIKWKKDTKRQIFLVLLTLVKTFKLWGFILDNSTKLCSGQSIILQDHCNILQSKVICYFTIWSKSDVS